MVPPPVSAASCAGPRARTELRARLEGRREEIEEAILARVSALAPERLDHEYAQGLREAVSAATEHALETVELGEERVPAAPTELLAQARRAARAGVGLDTVLRRYFAGHAVISDFLLAEATAGPVPRDGRLQHLLGAQGAVLDRIVAAVSAEHAAETERLRCSEKRRKAERIERLLAGERLDTSRLAYDFEGHHTALIARGQGSQEAIRSLAKQLDRRLLLVERPEQSAWAWLGGRESLDPEDLLACAREVLLPKHHLAAGEPGEGLAGWRTSHRQAKVAVPVALRRGEQCVRYADVALLAAIAGDELLAAWLRQRYLAPLEARRGGGALRETLRAYFAAGCNVSAAAAALGVRRQTVANRLQTIERRLKRPIESCRGETEIALRLEEPVVA